jgi:hypothetical protein
VSDYGLTTLIVGTSGRSPGARAVVMMAVAALAGFLIWLVWTMRKESQQEPVKAAAT